jgi:RimJ/RimL family protein N-acetyltransferase
VDTRPHTATTCITPGHTPKTGSTCAHQLRNPGTTWAFKHLDVDRLSLFIEPWNMASIKTAERAGYEFEGLLGNWERVGGVSRDMSSYVRTRSGKPD